MRSTIIFFFVFQFTASVCAQTISCSPQNRKSVEEKIQEIKGFSFDQLGEELVAIGNTFIGTPYVAQTLETGSDESLVIDLEGLDCTTFVENVLAFGIIGKNPQPNFDEFVKKLEKIRYREGKLRGYASRLHYFTEWVRDNEKKGLVKDITAALGGTEIPKELNFMTDHRSLYPALKDEKTYQEMITVEESTKNQSLCVLSVEMLKENEAMIESGDIIALATSIEGLDVTHTGFAIRMPDNRIHLLHASSKGAVEISESPLVEYLGNIKKNTGVIVARPVF
ncbi:N-acetylmuramoyl-L-alanine amidase-like domain-containing protein [Muriicola sp. SD30]|uniref:N-acetylmuramoyl-L-alanine amidase-like domain-containing protein n=1 Tax=Muriicola sp. SD30 TaxID=3240936 RepID=UPI00350FBC39